MEEREVVACQLIPERAQKENDRWKGMQFHPLCEHLSLI